MCAWPTRASASGRRRRRTAISTSPPSCPPPLVTGAEAIHPGYGFLAENAGFAEMVEAHGLTFIGPSPAHIRMMGDKIAAKAAMAKLGVPLVPGSDGAVPDVAKARDVAGRIGYPVLVKATAGGGGRGMKVARDAASLEEAFRVARTEARAAFGNDAVYIEKYLDHPRHIELQVLADGHGNVVHFGERDCSLQRRHQKLLEEAGSPALTADARDRLGATATDGAGVARLPQCGHAGVPVSGRPVRLHRDEHAPAGGASGDRDGLRHRPGARADPHRRRRARSATGRATSASPATRSSAASPPRTRRPSCRRPVASLRSMRRAVSGVRVDSALYAGYFVPPYYDSLVAKLIVHAPTRADAINRMRRALDEFAIVGIQTTIPLHQRIVDDPEFQRGDYTIHWLEQFVAR